MPGGRSAWRYQNISVSGRSPENGAWFGPKTVKFRIRQDYAVKLDALAAAADVSTAEYCRRVLTAEIQTQELRAIVGKVRGDEA